MSYQDRASAENEWVDIDDKVISTSISIQDVESLSKKYQLVINGPNLEHLHNKLPSDHLANICLSTHIFSRTSPS